LAWTPPFGWPGASEPTPWPMAVVWPPPCGQMGVAKATLIWSRGWLGHPHYAGVGVIGVVLATAFGHMGVADPSPLAMGVVRHRQGDRMGLAEPSSIGLGGDSATPKWLMGSPPTIFFFFFLKKKKGKR
jgi:hypothetical protein